MDLGRPAGHIAEHVDRQRDVGRFGHGQGLAVVERLQFRKFVAVLFEQIGQLPDQPSALRGRHPRPGARFECPPRRAYGRVDIGLLARRAMGNRFAAGRVEDLECVAAQGLFPLTVDQQLACPVKETQGLIAEWRGCQHGCHEIAPVSHVHLIPANGTRHACEQSVRSSNELYGSVSYGQNTQANAHLRPGCEVHFLPNWRNECRRPLCALHSLLNYARSTGARISRVVEQIGSLPGKRVKRTAPQAALPFGKERCDEGPSGRYRRRITCGRRARACPSGKC